MAFQPKTKVIAVGEHGAGKSSIICRAAQGTSDLSNYGNNAGVSMEKIIKTAKRGESVSLQLWDTAGNENFRKYHPLYFRGASAALLVFDITSKSGVDKINAWRTEIAENAPEAKVILVGNKVDLAGERRITEESARDIASSIGALFYCEVSAKTGDGIDELLQRIVDLIPTPVYGKETPPVLIVPDPHYRSGCYI